MTYKTGQAITFHHGMLDRSFVGIVLKSSKKGVVIELFDRLPEMQERRFLTHKQAEERLSVR